MRHPLFNFSNKKKTKKASTFPSRGFSVSEKLCIFLKINKINKYKFSIKTSFSSSPHCLLIPFSVRSSPVGTRHAVSVIHAAPIIGINFIFIGHGVPCPYNVCSVFNKNILFQFATLFINSFFCSLLTRKDTACLVRNACRTNYRY